MSEGLYRRITVGTDGSPNAQAALEAAIDVARHYEGSLVILAIAPLPPVYVSTTEPYIPTAVLQSQLSSYRQIVEAAVHQAEGAGVSNVTGLCDEGVVVDEILGHLQRHPTDLLVVG
ncbi:MAG: universal stress protein, partial [Thermoplasmata archaeon]